MCLLLLVSALAGVTVGTTTGAVAYMASVKSLIANLLMILSRQGNPVQSPLMVHRAGTNIPAAIAGGSCGLPTRFRALR